MPDDTKIIGSTGAVTGFDTPDPKDPDPEITYTSTPADDRVGSADASTYQPVHIPDAKEITGPFDHLATRDVTAMEHEPQAPEYEGAASTAGLGLSTTMLDSVVPGDGLASASMGVRMIDQHIQNAVDPNPHYTPPSQMTPPHVSEHSAYHPGDETGVPEAPPRDPEKR